MENFNEKISLPSSEVIIQSLNLKFNGQFQESNPDASYSFSVPVITGDTPDTLVYLPLNKLSQELLDGNIAEEEQLKALEGKRFCVVICRSFDRIDPETEIRHKLSPNNGSLCFIAAVWDAIEDPLMETTLYSCTFLSRDEGSGRIPYFLSADQVADWLSAEGNIQDHLRSFQNKTKQKVSEN